MKKETFEFEDNRFCIKISPNSEFSYNSFIIYDKEPVLIHTGRKKFFDATLSATKEVIDPARIAYIAFSHFEADECGALNEWLSVSPKAVPLVGAVGRASIEDLSVRNPRCLRDGDRLNLGSSSIEILETPHCPHGWDACMFYDPDKRILYSSDLGAQPRYGLQVDDDYSIDEIISFQRRFGFLSEGVDLERALLRLLDLDVKILATQHGSLLRGNVAKLLTALIDFSKSKETTERQKITCEDF